MSQGLEEFDKFKKELGEEWARVSVYDIQGLEKLTLKGYKPLILALMKKGLNVYVYIDRIRKKIRKFFFTFKATNGFENEFDMNTLDRFLRGAV